MTDPIKMFETVVKLVAGKDRKIKEQQTEIERLQDTIQDVICDSGSTELGTATMSKLQAAQGPATLRLRSPAEVECMEAEIERLQAIVDKLQNTTDRLSRACRQLIFEARERLAGRLSSLKTAIITGERALAAAEEGEAEGDIERLQEELLATQNAIRLILGRVQGVPWLHVSATDVESYVKNMRDLRQTGDSRLSEDGYRDGLAGRPCPDAYNHIDHPYFEGWDAGRCDRPSESVDLEMERRDPFGY